MMRVVLLNGPPGSGKDTIARRVAAYPPERFEEAKFATPLKQAAARLFPGVRWGMVGETDRDLPDVPHELLHGQTPRRVLIDLSESFFKQTFGVDYFGRLAVEHVQQRREFARVDGFVFSDSGFIEEALPLFAQFGAPRMCVVYLHRPGCSFTDDSRGFLPEDKLPRGTRLLVRVNQSWEDVANLTTELQSWLAGP